MQQRSAGHHSKPFTSGTVRVVAGTPTETTRRCSTSSARACPIQRPDHTMAKKRGSRGGSSGFEVVPAGANTSNSTTAATAKKPTSQNTLRQAHSNAMKKSEEIWFRKCGHGQRLFAEYYRATGSPIPPSDWPKFESAIKQSLPVTFRFRSAAINTAAQKDLEKRIRALGTVAPVPWAPAELGVWQATTDKRALSLAKREGDDPLAAALADGVSAGLLNRQECVSMLPVLALRVPAGGCVLDVCASPGQKTIQLLEAVSADGDEGRGMVVANDAHPKRVQALIEAIGRHARPASERQRLVVACHRGESFPAPMRPFRKKKQDSDDDAASASSSIGFDRVLADVPCSGDGTVRKDPTVLPRWTPAVGTQLHAAQLEIAWRGLNLLRVGGKMVYSTCSLNPIEDEAVVAALLARAEKLGGKGAVLLDKWPANVLPKLKRRAGLSTWRVADHVEASAGAAATEEEVQLRWHESHEAAVLRECRTRCQPSGRHQPRPRRGCASSGARACCRMIRIRAASLSPCCASGGRSAVKVVTGRRRHPGAQERVVVGSGPRPALQAAASCRRYPRRRRSHHCQTRRPMSRARA